ncbi:phosphotransferase family protein [Gynuella sp.]|uniref:phosphotransferase family protein n=1 Tax=Gynuella sp. TaxID=2969146 RepID=UPI003D13B61A
MELFEGNNCVLKQGASEVEIGFYQSAARLLTGVNTPKLFNVDGCDLCIEHIPNGITLKDLQSNPQTFKQLANLHNFQYTPVFPVKVHKWETAATEQALKILALSSEANATIESIQSISECLFEPLCLISGDTNDGNWGTRLNGELVLFDWERFGYGSPAIDLAPLVNGLGSVTDYDSMIGRYMQHRASLPEAELLRHVIIAKCWIIIEVVNILINRDNPEAGKYLNWYRDNVPQWLGSVKSVL